MVAAAAVTHQRREPRTYSFSMVVAGAMTHRRGDFLNHAFDSAPQQQKSSLYGKLNLKILQQSVAASQDILFCPNCFIKAAAVALCPARFCRLSLLL
jgi:hypothetical protein